MPKSKILTVRLPTEIRKRLEAEAKRKGLIISELARRKITQLVEDDPLLNEFVIDLSKRLDVSPSEFYEVLLYDFMARVDAEIEIYGSPAFAFIPFLKNPQGSILHGDELYKDLRSSYEYKFKREEENRLLEKEAGGEKISTRDRRFMIDNRIGRTWLESDECKAEQNLYKTFKALGQRAKEKGLVPNELDIPDVQLGKIYKNVVDGRITEKDFINEISNPFFMHFYDKNKFSPKENNNGAVE